MNDTNTPLPLLLTLDQVGELLQVHRRTVERLVASGELTSVHVGRSVRVVRRDLEAYVEQLGGAT